MTPFASRLRWTTGFIFLPLQCHPHSLYVFEYYLKRIIEHEAEERKVLHAKKNHTRKRTVEVDSPKN